jgi:uncharacterized integral membrane protein
VSESAGLPPADPAQRGSDSVHEHQAEANALQTPLLPVTRTGVAWWALGFSLALLVVVLIFVLQNLTDATTKFFGLTWTIPLGLDLLLAALLGGVIAFLLGGARMLQIRRVARRYSRNSKRP